MRTHLFLQQLALRAWRWRGEMMRGRVARAASTRTNIAKTFVQTMTMWSVFLCAGPLLVVLIERFAIEYLAIERFVGADWYFDFAGRQALALLLFVGGAALANFSAYFMVTRGEGTPLPSDCPRKMVVVGPYRHIRNPMALGSLAQGFAIGLALSSPLVLLYALAGTLGWNYLVRPWEEWDLEQRFGDDYARYRAAVRCWIPRCQPYKA